MTKRIKIVDRAGEDRALIIEPSGEVFEIGSAEIIEIESEAYEFGETVEIEISPKLTSVWLRTKTNYDKTLKVTADGLVAIRR